MESDTYQVFLPTRASIKSCSEKLDQDEFDGWPYLARRIIYCERRTKLLRRRSTDQKAYPLTGRLRGLLAPILERPLSTSTPLVNLPFQSNHATAADKVPKRGTVATQSHNHKPQGNNGQNTDDCHKTTKPSVRETEKELRKTRKQYLQAANTKWACTIEENLKTLMQIWCAKHGPEKAGSTMSAKIRDAGMEQYVSVVLTPAQTN